MKKFDFNTINDFDDHIAKSIPNYDILFDSIISISDYFITTNGTIYDLGCSTGRLLKSLPYQNTKIGYDYSKLLPVDDKIEFRNIDLGKPFELQNACLVYSIFTMQFLDKENRGQYLRTIYHGLNKGGALILCEKNYQKQGMFQDILNGSHYDYKRKFFTEEEIWAKEKDLRYLMKPLTFEENLNLLKEVGFTNITTFWQMFNFIGILAIK